eukprot:15327960-Ditylum_brightwellii.AAC.2
MKCQRFNCVAEGQAKLIKFCENLDSLDPPMVTKRKGNNVDTPSMVEAASGCFPKRKRSDSKKTSRLMPNLIEKKNVSKFCLLYGKGNYTATK